ncbi:dihydroxyacetone kinase subunit DhaL [Thermasporomyces composti]|jgi:dihydroxyacetone kinase-like protein|uniref:Dihydroxyacetone kinase DhaL subunit n=1 Tax=Thermasporomyces composti TaxID=696763 RepID=A0A3D9VF72_THECX|nr:dihydroxyacetone kinase subunit DhaL [Thermasporomyces composti]REF36794.1 dihydroxyacetone kinase DhaL subunit [Thermasporomyces composti]
MPVTTRDVRDLVEAYARVVADNRDYLVELDAAIGDADHGANLDRGMQAAVATLPDPDSATPSDVLRGVATALISKVGGAAGPLYGTAFLRASTAVKDRPELTAEDVVAAIRAGLDGVVARGKAEPGDKTMVDAWEAAARAAERALASGAPLSQILAAAADAAEEGMRATIPLVARKGRASYLGERSAGHQDPGATSTALLFRAMADQAAGRSAA